MTNTAILESKELISDQIATRFRDEIEAGQYDPIKPLPSFSSLAQSYGISKSTVHQAFVRLAKEGYLYIKHGKGAFVNSARIKTKKERRLSDVALIAFNIFSANDNYVISLMEAMNNQAAEGNISLHFHFIQGMSVLDGPNAVVKNAVAENRYQGLIIVSPLDTRDIQWLQGLKIPFVAATSHYDLNIPQVLLDNDEAGRLAVEMFAQAGRTQVAVLTGPLSWERDHIAPHAAEIRDSFLKYAAEKGLKPDFIPCEYSYADAKAKTTGCLACRKTYDGFFFQSDIIAKGAMAALAQADSQGLTLINYSDLEDYLAPVSIRKPLKEMGEQALALLTSLFLNRETKERQIVLKPQLIQHGGQNG